MQIDKNQSIIQIQAQTKKENWQKHSETEKSNFQLNNSHGL